MKRQVFSLTVLAMVGWVSLESSNTAAWAQGGRWGLGAGSGASVLYSDLKKTDFGVGGQAYLTRRLNSHLGLTAAASYNSLPFTIPTNPAKLTTNALRGDLLFDYEVGGGKIRPYIGVGVGAVNYQITAKLNGKTFKGAKRMTNAAFGPSAGLRFMLGSRFALDLGGSFRYTTGDGLDATTTTKAKDGIIGAMLGLTIFGGGGGGPADIIAEQAPAEETQSQDDLSAFQQRIDQMESAPAEQPQDMQEYVRLKSRKDELDQQIVQKESEANSLRAAVEQKNTSVQTMQTQLTSAPMSSSVSSASFSRAYEEALSKFYAKRYAESIEQFNGLVAQFPDHPRVSNCVYWIGESHFGAGNYSEAANAFTQVLGYPRALKQDDALLMLGRAHVQLNQKDAAREAFNRLVSEFPNSEFVGKAQEWLRKI